MAIKIFPYNGTYSSFVGHLNSIDGMHRAAIKYASEGEYCLAITMFRRAFNMLPRMPRDWRQHDMVLQEIRLAMENHLSQTIMKEAQAVHAHLHALLQQREADDAPECLDYLLEEHVRDVEFFVNTAASVSRLGMSVDHMCTHGVGITDARLRQLEVMFLGPGEK